MFDKFINLYLHIYNTALRITVALRLNAPAGTPHSFICGSPVDEFGLLRSRLQMSQVKRSSVVHVTICKMT